MRQIAAITKSERAGRGCAVCSLQTGARAPRGPFERAYAHSARCQSWRRACADCRERYRSRRSPRPSGPIVTAVSQDRTRSPNAAGALSSEAQRGVVRSGHRQCAPGDHHHVRCSFPHHASVYRRRSTAIPFAAMSTGADGYWLRERLSLRKRTALLLAVAEDRRLRFTSSGATR